MHTVRVKLRGRTYGILIQPGLLDRLGEVTKRALGDEIRRAVLVTNPHIDALYGRAVRISLKQAGVSVKAYRIGDGERFKSLRTAESLYTFMIRERIERGDIVIALGGGVVGDLAGFVAGTYLRGVRLVQVPTTLLAQIDSSVGGKTGVNHKLGKNLIGVYHQPSLVAIDPQTLASLPLRERCAGLYEAVKYGVIKDRDLFVWITENIDRLRSLDLEATSSLITRCCEIKAWVVERDEREGGLRRILNFGHTVGHALEAVTSYRRFLHGEAVGHGMRVASRLAERLELLGPADRQAIDDLVLEVGRLPSIKNLALGDIMSAMQRDKKVEGGRLAFVLPLRIGRVVVRSDVPQRLVASAIRAALL
jgi:3-dehydroquinate synthase